MVKGIFKITLHQKKIQCKKNLIHIEVLLINLWVYHLQQNRWKNLLKILYKT